MTTNEHEQESAATYRPALGSREKRLEVALKIAADQLEGMVLCLKAHGTNLNLPYLIEHLTKHAEQARMELQ